MFVLLPDGTSDNNSFLQVEIEPIVVLFTVTLTSCFCIENLNLSFFNKKFVIKFCKNVVGEKIMRFMRYVCVCNLWMETPYDNNNSDSLISSKLF